MAELAAVEGIGPVIADSVVEFMASSANRRVIDKLRLDGVALVEPGGRVPGPAGAASSSSGSASGGDSAEAGVIDGLDQTLQGRSVVVTGTVEGYTREEAEEAILARGGKSPGSVSARTWAVVLGTDPGAAKLKRAEALGIPVVPGNRFQELLDSGELPES
jgi:DNA ligase (NAD+)